MIFGFGMGRMRGGQNNFPKTLTAHGWWRDYSTSAPLATVWTPQASAGTSASRTWDINEAGAGTEQNGRVPARLTGGNNRLRMTEQLGAIGVSVSAYAGWMLLKVETSFVDERDVCGAFADTASGWKFDKSTGLIRLTHNGTGGVVSLTQSLADGEFALIFFRLASGTLSLRRSTTSWSTIAATNLNSVALQYSFGAHNSNATGCNVLFYDAGLLSSLSDPDADGVTAYCRSRYNLHGVI